VGKQETLNPYREISKTKKKGGGGKREDNLEGLHGSKRQERGDLVGEKNGRVRTARGKMTDRDALGGRFNNEH